MDLFVAERQKQLHNIVEIIPDGVILLDLQGHITFLNSAAERILDIARDDFLGKHYDALGKIVPLDGALSPSPERGLDLARFVDAGLPLCGAEYALQRDDARIILSVNAAPLFDGEGVLIGLATSFVDVSDRKAAEEALQESRERFRSLIDTAVGVIILLSPDFKIIEFNPEAERLYGYRRAEVLGKDYIEFFVPPEAREAVAADGRKVLAGEPTRGFENAVTTRTGEERILTWNVSRLLDARGQAGGLIAIGTDITKRKRAEEALRESEERFRSTFEDAPIGMAIVGLDGSFLQVNKSWCDIVGYSEEESIGQTFSDITYLDDIGSSLVNLRRMIRGEMDFVKAEKRYVHKDGHLLWALLSVSLVRDAEGRPQYFVSQIQDISERKKTERTLRDSENRYRRLVDSANDAIFVADVETGKIIDANQRAAELIGRPVTEIIGMHQSQLHPSEEAERYRAIFEQYIAKGQGVAPDLLAQHKDGRKIPIEISASMVEIGGRTVMQGIFRDMTESKRLETERQRANELSDALNSTNTAINSTLDFREIMESVVVQATNAVGSETGVIYLREGDEWVIRHVHKLPSELVGLRWTHEESPLLNLTTRTRSPVVSNDVLQDERFDQELMERYGTRSLLSVPLVHREEVIGVLLFEHHAKAVPFAEPEIDFANKLAAAVSLAVENARLYAAERNVADSLQRALLALPKHLEGIEFGSLYRSSTATSEVGGDFYDLFELAGGRIGITVGDVSGKGLEAASLTSLVKNTIRAYAHLDWSPASVLAKTNETVSLSLGPSMFVTAFFGILDTQTGDLRYCSAGHPEGIIRRESGVSALKTRSPALGTFAELRFVEDQDRLSRKDILVLYTDGVTEARCSKRGFFGEERLAAAIAGLSNPVPKKVPQAILGQVAECPDCSLTDDIVIVAVSLAG